MEQSEGAEETCTSPLDWITESVSGETVFALGLVVLGVLQANGER